MRARERERCSQRKREGESRGAYDRVHPQVKLVTNTLYSTVQYLMLSSAAHAVTQRMQRGGSRWGPPPSVSFVRWCLSFRARKTAVQETGRWFKSCYVLLYYAMNALDGACVAFSCVSTDYYCRECTRCRCPFASTCRIRYSAANFDAQYSVCVWDMGVALLDGMYGRFGKTSGVRI